MIQLLQCMFFQEHELLRIQKHGVRTTKLNATEYKFHLWASHQNQQNIEC